MHAGCAVRATVATLAALVRQGKPAPGGRGRRLLVWTVRPLALGLPHARWVSRALRLCCWIWDPRAVLEPARHVTQENQLRNAEAGRHQGMRLKRTTAGLRSLRNGKRCTSGRVPPGPAQGSWALTSSPWLLTPVLLSRALAPV